MRAPRRDQLGVVLPVSALLASLCAIVVAAVGLLLTSAPMKKPPPAVLGVSSTQTPTPTTTPSSTRTVTRTATPTPTPHHTRQPVVVDRKGTYVQVFNNSNVKGLAGRTATRAQQAGWNVVGTDNWYGTVDASTVYYPARLKAAARVLAKDLGISRVRPAISPMQLDRLTVILTGDYTS